MRRFLTATAALVGLLTPATAWAQDDDAWAFDASFYIWAISMKGDMTVMGNTVDVDVPFSELLEDLSMGLFAKGEARKGRFFGIVDFNGSLLESDQKTGTRTIGFGPQTVRGGPRGNLRIDIPRVTATVGPAEIETKTKMIVVKFAGGYRFVSRNVGGNEARRLNLDGYVGGRYMRLDNEIDIKVPPVKIPGFTVSASARTPLGRVDLGSAKLGGVTVGGVDQSVETVVDWVDLLFGLRLTYDLGRSWTFTLWGDVGGFGIGSSADLSWETAALVAWHFGESWSLMGGYRALGIDYTRGSNGMDVVMHGPVIAITYRWGAAKRPKT